MFESTHCLIAQLTKGCRSGFRPVKLGNRRNFVLACLRAGHGRHERYRLLMIPRNPFHRLFILSRGPNQPSIARGKVNDVLSQKNSDLTRLVLNAADQPG